jgi:uncharacterized RDD family membrane protein YckC
MLASGEAMECPHCARDTPTTQIFCVWCHTFLPLPPAGAQAGCGRRLLATFFDLATVAAAVGFVALAGSGGWSALTSAVVPAVGLVAWMLAARARTPGKCLLGLRAVDAGTGRAPGIGRLLVRELVLKPLGLLAFGLGVVPAVHDQGRRTGHDRTSGTVVVRDRRIRVDG